MPQMSVYILTILDETCFGNIVVHNHFTTFFLII